MTLSIPNRIKGMYTQAETVVGNPTMNIMYPEKAKAVAPRREAPSLMPRYFRYHRISNPETMIFKKVVIANKAGIQERGNNVNMTTKGSKRL